MQAMVSNMTAEANTCMGGAAGRSPRKVRERRFPARACRADPSDRQPVPAGADYISSETPDGSFFSARKVAGQPLE